MARTGNYIHDDSAYNAAIQRRIAENARKGRMQRGQAWLDADPTRAALVEWVQQHDRSGFIAKMADALREYYSLTAGQEAAVRRIMASEDAKRAEHDVKRAAIAATSQYVGQVGERASFTFTLDHVTAVDTHFGTMHIHSGRDADGNVMVYKGSKALPVSRGDTVTLRATVKAHSEYRGCPQTQLSRPVVEGTDRVAARAA